MSKLIAWEPPEAAFARAWRSLRVILERGLRWEDQIGPTVDFRYDSSVSSHEVKVTGESPLAVLCLDAQPDPPDGTHTSGEPVAWSWDGSTLTVTDVGSLSGTYTVRLGIVR